MIKNNCDIYPHWNSFFENSKIAQLIYLQTYILSFVFLTFQPLDPYIRVYTILPAVRMYDTIIFLM